MLITILPTNTSFHQFLYSQFTATLRHANPDNEHPICMKLDLSAGHFSASDRYKYYKELAYDYSFLLDQLNLAWDLRDR